jgi:hypothetical protein
MKRLIKAMTITILGYGFIVACSKVEFSNVPNSNAGCTGSCLGTQGNGSYNYSYTTGSGQTDLLFVIDNSASMSPIQASIGSKFPSLFNIVAGIDYHIGVVTTDISNIYDDSQTNSTNYPRNMLAGHPYFQDGNLITMTDGSSFLTSASSNPMGQFNTAINRNETVNCQNWLQAYCPDGGCDDQSSEYYDNCPSDQTRAIFASVLNVQKNPAGFLRDASVPLNVVVISNADERAAGGQVPGYPLLTDDLPATLLTTVQTQIPGKQLKVHSIIIQPGDSSCYNSQKNFDGDPAIFGWYAPVYQSLTSMTGGIQGTVCAADYSAQLASIAVSSTVDNGNRDLPCTPQNGVVNVTLSNGVIDGWQVTTGQSGTPILVFNQPLPPGTTVTLQFQCAS